MSEGTPPSDEAGMHRIVSVPVIFHAADGTVCPRSRGAKSCPLDDAASGAPRFEGGADDLARMDTVQDLRRLAGCLELAQKLNRIASLLPNGLNGLRLLQQQQGELLLEDERGLGLDVPGSVTSGIRTDSGVGESIESGGKPGYPFGGAGELIVNQGYAGGVGSAGLDTILSQLDSLQQQRKPTTEGDDGGLNNDDMDTAGPLPSRSEIRRYERKQQMGLHFLANMTPQQLAAMSPELKSSMDNFIHQLHGVRRSQRRRRYFAYGGSCSLLTHYVGHRCGCDRSRNQFLRSHAALIPPSLAAVAVDDGDDFA